MKALSLSLCAAVLCMTGVGAVAQSQAPGLWEQTISMKTEGGSGTDDAMAEMQAQMAAMPAQQRKQMEEMMAKRGVAMGPKGTSMRRCVSPEEAASPMGPKMADPNCTQQVVKRTASALKVTWQCTGANPSTGEGEFTFLSDKAYSGKAVMTQTVKGKPERMNVEQSGRWLSADCGDLKPAPAAKR